MCLMISKTLLDGDVLLSDVHLELEDDDLDDVIHHLELEDDDLDDVIPPLSFEVMMKKLKMTKLKGLN